jgi:hypothetical protein
MTTGRRKKRHLSDGYRFDGFRPLDGQVRGVFGGNVARILPLERRSKKPFADVVAQCTISGMTANAS